MSFETERDLPREVQLLLAGNYLSRKTSSAKIYIYIKREKKTEKIPRTEEYTWDDEKRLQFFEVYDEYVLRQSRKCRAEIFERRKETLFC